MAKSSKTQDLLKVLGRNTPSLPAQTEQAPPHPPAKPSGSPRSRGPRTSQLASDQARPAAQPPVRGKAIQFYLHPEDEKLIREVAVWLAPHRKRINDSLVIKTVLRAAKTGPDLLAAYDAAVKIDGRTQKTGQPEAI